MHKTFLQNFERLEWKRETATRESLHNASVTKWLTNSCEWRAAVHEHITFSILSRRTLATIHVDFFFFCEGSKEETGANWLQRARRSDTSHLHSVTVLFSACVSSSLLPIKSWNNFPSKKQQGAAEFSSLSESHYLRCPANPFCPGFAPILSLQTNIIENIQS